MGFEFRNALKNGQGPLENLAPLLLLKADGFNWSLGNALENGERPPSKQTTRQEAVSSSPQRSRGLWDVRGRGVGGLNRVCLEVGLIPSSDSLLGLWIYTGKESNLH